jgi:hypothetical protein
MNYKALLLGFLLLIPVGLMAGPRGDSTEFVEPSLYVAPPETNLFGPSLESSYFSIDVILWNNPLSGVDVYAFDFDLNWSSIPSGYISLVNATAHAPWANSFTIVNTNSTTPATDWHLAMMAIPPSTGLYDVNQSVLTLWFHVDQNICYAAEITGCFLITNAEMSGDGSSAVKIANMEIDNGTLEMSAPQPNIDLSTKDPAYNATTNTITEKCSSHTFDIEVDLTNVTNVYGFYFTMTYCPCHLETDAQYITFKAAFPPPYETLNVNLSTAGVISICLCRPCEKPTVQADPILPAVDIVFHTIDALYNPPNNLPTPSTTNITITQAAVYVKCPCTCTTEYDFNCGNGLLLFGGPIQYYFKPSMYDLNLDCVVDVQDLMTLLPYYGETTAVGGFGSIWNSTATVVDVYDFVAIAKNFGPVDP